MIGRFLRVYLHGAGDIRGRVVGMYVLLIAANLLVWAVALAAFHRFPLLIGTSVLAYTFGLRHAVDADHIAAIDSVTRKLMQEGKRSVSVGFFFSLGHSTIVVLASIAIAVTATAIKRNFPSFQEIGSLVGTSVSAVFLFLIALINIVVLLDVFGTFQKVKRGGAYDEELLNDMLDQRGILGRFFRPLFRLISQSWHMYPLGILFGLGFDTATEIGLLGLSAAQASRGLSIWSILVFPALFTVGMSLIDTTDGILMLGAYGWAYVRPVRRLYYNLAITVVSVLVALFVGSIEALGILREELGLRGGLWTFVGTLSGNFTSIGYLIIAIFVLSWLFSTLIYKLKRYDEIEIRAHGD